LGTDGGTNYSHWLSRIVLKLAVLEAAGISTSISMLINDNLARYQREFLSLLDIPDERLLMLPKGIAVHCREILVPVMVRNHPRMRDAITWLRAKLAAYISPADEANERLFVSRRDSSVRVLLNESEIESALADLGFKTVVLGELSVVDQIRCFSRASVIVGAHGAGLSNLIFAPAHSRVVEITNTRVRHMKDFRIITAQMGMHYTEVVSAWYADSREEAPLQNPQHRDYSVNVGDVVAAVLEIAPELSG
jgi:capsular polysaccharide biosynthesis protein